MYIDDVLLARFTLLESNQVTRSDRVGHELEQLPDMSRVIRWGWPWHIETIIAIQQEFLVAHEPLAPLGHKFALLTRILIFLTADVDHVLSLLLL